MEDKLFRLYSGSKWKFQWLNKKKNSQAHNSLIRQKMHRYVSACITGRQPSDLSDWLGNHEILQISQRREVMKKAWGWKREKAPWKWAVRGDVRVEIERPYKDQLKPLNPFLPHTQPGVYSLTCEQCWLAHSNVLTEHVVSLHNVSFIVCKNRENSRIWLCTTWI